jgi:hypothetical protein
MRRFIPRWRKATWALVIWCVLILVWAIAGSASNDCASQATDLDQSACEAGTGIGVLLILFIGFFGFVFFSLIWLMSRPRKRACPRCGEDVKKGVMVCPSCRFDFHAVGQPQAPVPAADRPREPVP